MKKKNIFLVILCIALVCLSFVIGTIRGGEFAGADDKIQSTITQINPNYKPWFKHLWQPPSSEIESLLFALQAAAGAGFIGYFVGYNVGKKKKC